MLPAGRDRDTAPPQVPHRSGRTRVAEALSGRKQGMSAPQDRYEVRPGGQRFANLDMQMRPYCSLGGTTVAWRTRRQAHDGLRLCYFVWGTSLAVGDEPPAR